MTVQDLIKNKGNQVCCGCTACKTVCPKQCITMVEDSEGFLYPKVDTNLCIDCQACLRVCPFHNPTEEAKPKSVYAALNKNEEIRKPTETIEGLAAFRGSKYLQAKMGNSLSLAKKYLREGRKVLFSGTPCQIAGMKHYLRKDYDNLLAVDFVCHGVPSPKVWRMYLDEVTQAGKRAISDIKFRDKPQGWKRFNFTLSYNESEKSYTMSSYNGDNHFMRAFLSDMILRPSCYNCQAKCGRSKSDLTIADYWGIDQVHPQMDDDKGASLLIVRTDKGQQALDFTQMAYTASTYDDAFRFNPAIEKSAVPHPKRTEFFRKLDTTKDLIKLIDKELRPALKQRVRKFYHRCRHKAKVLALHLLGGGSQERGNFATVRNTGVVPMCDKEMAIKTISFRNKGNGWKKYRMTFNIEQICNTRKFGDPSTESNKEK